MSKKSLRSIGTLTLVLDEVGDVLTGGLTQPFSFFTDPLM